MPVVRANRREQVKMSKKTVIADLQNPMKDVRDAVVEITDQLARVRNAAAHLRTADQFASLTSDDPHRVAAGERQLAIDAFAESIGHAVARMVEVRAHVALANAAMAKINRLQPTVEPKGPLS